MVVVVVIKEEEDEVVVVVMVVVMAVVAAAVVVVVVAQAIGGKQVVATHSLSLATQTTHLVRNELHRAVKSAKQPRNETRVKPSHTLCSQDSAHRVSDASVVACRTVGRVHLEDHSCFYHPLRWQKVVRW